MTTYLLDTNVFIQAKNLHYGLDFCPAFWDWLLESNTVKRVFSIDKVSDEIAKGADALTQWAQQAKELFLPTDALVVSHLSKVSSWTMQQPYKPAAKSTFLQAADYYLIAHALAAPERVVVTHEKPENSLNKIKIPNVCIGFNLKFVTPFEMLRQERAKFVLGPMASTAKQKPPPPSE